MMQAEHLTNETDNMMILKYITKFAVVTYLCLFSPFLSTASANSSGGKYFSSYFSESYLSFTEENNLDPKRANSKSLYKEKFPKRSLYAPDFPLIVDGIVKGEIPLLFDALPEKVKEIYDEYKGKENERKNARYAADYLWIEENFLAYDLILRERGLPPIIDDAFYAASVASEEIQPADDFLAIQNIVKKRVPSVICTEGNIDAALLKTGSIFNALSSLKKGNAEIKNDYCSFYSLAYEAQIGAQKISDINCVKMGSWHSCSLNIWLTCREYIVYSNIDKKESECIYSRLFKTTPQPASAIFQYRETNNTWLMREFRLLGE